MNEIFSSIYEFGGLLPFYSADLGDHLRGFDKSCSDYTSSPYYTYVGVFMLVSCVLVGLLHYYILDRPDYNSKYSWWITTGVLVTLNMAFAFAIASNSLEPGYFCKELIISSGDLIGFGIANAVCSFGFYLILTSIPVLRAKSINCKHTTFYKP